VGIFGSGSSKSDRVLKLIALFRLSKALLLILAGAGVLQLLNPGTAVRVREWMEAFPFAMKHHPERMLNSPERIELAAVATFAYAALFTVEGIGLWMQKDWAEYLTIIATTSFIPFEIWEIVKKVTALRVALVILNIAIVIYLIVRLTREHRSRRFAR
jgi:uncharacterized membrane protein (DUF2068 family)